MSRVAQPTGLKPADITGASTKATPVSADGIVIVDSEDGNALKRVSPDNLGGPSNVIDVSGGVLIHDGDGSTPGTLRASTATVAAIIASQDSDCQIVSAGGSGWRFTDNAGTSRAKVYNMGLVVGDVDAIGWSNTNAGGSLETQYRRDAAGITHQRNGTAAQTSRLANTYTSATNYECYQVKCNTTEIRVGSAVGSAGGSNRDLEFGHWDTSGTFTPHLTLSASGPTVLATGASATVDDVITLLQSLNLCKQS